jgi:hypothetical protein
MVKCATSRCNLQRNIVAWQVARTDCPFYNLKEVQNNCNLSSVYYHTLIASVSSFICVFILLTAQQLVLILYIIYYSLTLIWLSLTFISTLSCVFCLASDEHCLVSDEHRSVSDEHRSVRDTFCLVSSEHCLASSNICEDMLSCTCLSVSWRTTCTKHPCSLYGQSTTALAQTLVRWSFKSILTITNNIRLTFI